MQKMSPFIALLLCIMHSNFCRNISPVIFLSFSLLLYYTRIIGIYLSINYKYCTSSLVCPIVLVLSKAFIVYSALLIHHINCIFLCK